MTDGRSSGWFQLSLKSLFMLTLVIAAFFAGYSLAERRAGDALRAAREAQLLAEKSARQNAADSQRLHALFRSENEVKVWQDIVHPSPIAPDR